MHYDARMEDTRGSPSLRALGYHVYNRMNEVREKTACDRLLDS